MKIRFLASVVLILIILSSCAQKEAQGESSLAEISDHAVEDAAQNAQSGITDPEIVSEADSKAFSVAAETGNYDFNGDGQTGSFTTEFNAAENAESGITITLSDGRTMNLNYTEIVYDEAEELYKTEINGLTFRIDESYTAENNLCQTFQCIENIEGFSNKTDSTITVIYYPELGYGRINMSFLYEKTDDKYTLHYPDGNKIIKTVIYDKEAEEYKFGK